jgi:four helix bundle protein
MLNEKLNYNIVEKKDVLKEKSFEFAIRIVKLVQYLQSEKKEFVLSKQLLRSATAIGTLISEAQFEQSKADFLDKMYIALKEANESIYWLELLHATEYLTHNQFEDICSDSKEMLALLIAAMKSKLNK